MKRVYRYSESFGRMGDLESVFVTDEETIAKLREKRRLPLGEVLGKHSQIDATIDDSTISMISEEQVIVDFVMHSLGGVVGIDIVGRFGDLEADGYWK